MTKGESERTTHDLPEIPLIQLVEGLEDLGRMSHHNPLIRGIAYHSQAVSPGDLFVCIKGGRNDGHLYAREAVSRGAVALVLERPLESLDTVAQVCVTDSRRALAHLAARFYGYPSTKLQMIGVTGTEGKTTTAYLLDSILQAAGRRTGLFGTIVNRIGTTVSASTLTTPESLDLQRLLWGCVQAGVTDVVMEASSHALAQGRLVECEFDVAVFTNLHSDHLDFHGTSERYFQAKAKLFATLGVGQAKAGRGFGVLNADDPSSDRMAAVCRQPVMKFGFERPADVSGRIIQVDLGRTVFVAETPAGPLRAALPLTGAFNASNALAATSAAIALGVDPKTIISGLESLRGVPGRFELVTNDRGLLIVVDFAHTLAAFAEVLPTLQRFTRGRLITVFGCAGDRDRTHRAAIGNLVTRLSDFTIVTTDNPASEDPEDIAREVLVGVRAVDPSGEGHRAILDRQKAVEQAISLAREDDTVLLAGKGHEVYQIMKGQRIPYSDRQIVEKILGR
jgi:UDP-N-acetylmuramoyl-L-alanyl-D-glutamate--2,6-diaminopimelate ligase